MSWDTKLILPKDTEMGVNIVSGHFILQGNTRSSVPHMKAHNSNSLDNEDSDNTDSKNTFEQVKISHTSGFPVAEGHYLLSFSFLMILELRILVQGQRYRWTDICYL